MGVVRAAGWALGHSRILKIDSWPCLRRRILKVFLFSFVFFLIFWGSWALPQLPRGPRGTLGQAGPWGSWGTQVPPWDNFPQMGISGEGFLGSSPQGPPLGPSGI